MTAADFDALADQLAVTVGPALVAAVDRRDARLVEQLLSGLDRQRLLALAVVLAAGLTTDLDAPVPADPDDRPLSKTAARHEDYAWCRHHDASLQEAARRVGISVKNAERRYEPALTGGVRGEGAA